MIRDLQLAWRMDLQFLNLFIIINLRPGVSLQIKN